MTKLWARTKLVAHKLDRYIVLIFNVLAMIFLVSSTLLLISLTIGQFDSSGPINNLSEQVNAFFLSFFGIERSTFGEDEYRKLLSSLIATIAVLVTIWFAIITYVKHKHYQTVLRREALIENWPVFTDGVEDLSCMHEYFRLASSVTVFSGDFSWIKEHEALHAEVIRLANEEKITLISSKPSRLVRSAIGVELFGQLKKHFKFDSGLDLKCSLVKNSSSSAFLYKVDKSLESGGKSVCIVSGKNNAAYLLETLGKLCHSDILG